MAEKSAELADRLRRDFVGPLSEQEIDFLRDVQGFIEFAIRNRLSFPMIVATVNRDLSELFRAGFDLDTAKARGGFLAKATGELADRLCRGSVGPLLEQEIEFLWDVQGFIEFAIRNGLSIPTIVGTLGHDFNDLFQEAFDLDAQKAKGSLPKVTGYSKVTAEDFGESEELDG